MKRGLNALPRRERVAGRIFEVITATTGAYVSPVYLRHLIGVGHHPGSLARQTDPAFPDDDFAQVAALGRCDLPNGLGARAQPAIFRVADLPPSESGEMLYVRTLHRG